ncbi:MAG: hypothetical protein IPH18_18195 [Chitinophagaceae bacterium]|nr:hypothetical protein [Chitinophagaceae bacterium]
MTNPCKWPVRKQCYTTTTLQTTTYSFRHKTLKRLSVESDRMLSLAFGEKEFRNAA